MQFREDDTIAAISTPPGEGGIAVIRISGTEAVKIVEKVFQPRQDSVCWENHKATHGWIFDGAEPVDEVLVTIHRSPHSYTGEDVVEVSCHGGGYVSRRILELFTHHGARPAGPGEFTQRAFIHGKMDLSQAEAVADLIRARTEAARRVAVYQLEGRLSKRMDKIRQDLIHGCSLLELELDFGEEDVQFASREELVRMIQSIRHEMTTLIRTFDRGRICRNGIRMVIAGRPNVGKSSILNCLLERERAIVTEVPGTTRDTVEDVLDIEGLLFVITDTAGVRKTEDPVEKEGVRRAEKAIEKADFILLVLDGSEPWHHDDETLIHYLYSMEKRILCVINKIDLKRKLTKKTLKNKLKEKQFLEVSALKQQGIKKLINILKEKGLSGDIPSEGEIILTHVRHRDCISRSIEKLKEAEISLRKGMSQEFVTLDLRGALDSLGEITGETTTDEILNCIFSDFCIGK